jgi:transcriptional regulator with XRE-family HTH domain
MGNREFMAIRQEIDEISVNNAATGRKIRDMCIENNMTLNQLSELLGFTCQQAIYNWMEGKSSPSLKNLVKIKTIFKCDLNDLVQTCFIPQKY